MKNNKKQSPEPRAPLRTRLRGLVWPTATGPMTLLERHGGWRSLIKVVEARSVTIASLSAIIGCAAGTINFFFGLIGELAWIAINGLFVLTLASGRAHIVRRLIAIKTRIHPADREAGLPAELRIYRGSGRILTLAGLVYLGLSIHTLAQQDSPKFPNWIAYGIAAAAFTQLITAIYSIRRTSTAKTPALAALRMYSLAAAMISIVTTQCALLLQQSEPSAQTSSAKLGIAVAIIIIASGLRMALDRRATPTT